MESNATYLYMCTASTSDGSISGHSKVNIVVDPNDLVVRLNRDDSEIATRNEITLSAATSYDPDDPENLGIEY